VRLLCGEEVMARQLQPVGAGVLLGLLVLVVAGRADEAVAVKAIEKLGGTVTVDDKRPGKPILGIDLYGTDIPDAELKGLKSCARRSRSGPGFSLHWAGPPATFDDGFVTSRPYPPDFPRLSEIRPSQDAPVAANPFDRLATHSRPAD
jgi:hypothetical protein